MLWWVSESLWLSPWEMPHHCVSDRLLVEVKDEHPLALLSQSITEVEGGGGFANATFFHDDGDDGGQHLGRMRRRCRGRKRRAGSQSILLGCLRAGKFKYVVHATKYTMQIYLLAIMSSAECG